MADEQVVITEEDELAAWRYVQLQALGVGAVDALRLAWRSDDVVHRVADLIGAGCPAATAVEIVE